MRGVSGKKPKPPVGFGRMRGVSGKNRNPLGSRLFMIEFVTQET